MGERRSGRIILFLLLLSFLLHIDYLYFRCFQCSRWKTEEIRGTEKLLPKRYFLDFILVSSETTSITRSLSMETRTVILWLVAYSFLEHSTSQGGSRDPREFLRPFQGGCKVKTTFIMILRCAVPFSLSFSHECTVCFKETIVCCC